MRDGKTQQTKILGVTGSSVQIQVGAGSLGVPLGNIASVTMAAPADFAAGVAMFLIRRGFSYVPVTLTTLAFWNYFRFIRQAADNGGYRGQRSHGRNLL